MKHQKNYFSKKSQYFDHVWRIILCCLILTNVFSCKQETKTRPPNNSSKGVVLDSEIDKSKLIDNEKKAEIKTINPKVKKENSNIPPSTLPKEVIKETTLNPTKTTTKTAISIREHTQISLDSLKVCSFTDSTYWQSIIDAQLGVHGFNPPNNGKWIDHTSLRKFYAADVFFINNWFPLWEEKMVFCGTLQGYNVYQENKGVDWNFYLSPSPGNEPFIENAKAFKGSCGLLFFIGDKWVKCTSDPAIYCLEGEVSPHESFDGQPWFPIPDPSPDAYGPLPRLVSQDICLYGPWVRECVHQQRPEIHPSELLWWRDNTDNSFHLMVVQDASNRFGFEERYVGPKESPWQPWAKEALSAVFIIPFEINPATDDILNFNISNTFSLNVCTDSISAVDSDDGNIHTLLIDGKEKMVIYENQAIDEDLGVQYVNISKRADGKVQGYVQIMLQVGKDVKDNEGLYLMKIDTQTIPAASAPLIASTRQISPVPGEFLSPISSKTNDPRIYVKPKTISPKVINGQPVLMAEFEIKALGKEKLEKDSLIIKRSALKRSLKAPIDLLEDTINQFRVKNILLADLASDSFTVSYKEQTIQFAETNSEFMLIPMLKEQQKDETLANGKTREILNKELGLSLQNEQEINAIEYIEFGIHPYYCPGDDDGNCEMEEEGDYLNEMNIWANEAVNESTFKAEWAVFVLNLETGVETEMDLKDTLNQVDNLQIIGKSIRFSGCTIQVHLGEPNKAVYQIRATASITDIFGTKGATSFIFYTHEYHPQISRSLKGKSRFLEKITKSIGLSYTDLFAKRWNARQLGTPQSIYQKGSVRPDFEELKYQVVLNYYDQITFDNKISINELKGLIKSIKYIQVEEF